MSAEVRTIDGPRTAELQLVLGGFVDFENGGKTSPPIPLPPYLSKDQALGRIDVGYIPSDGMFGCKKQ